MPLTPGTARVIDPVLTNIALGYQHPELIGHRLFPPVPVGQRGGKVLQFGKESFMLVDARRAPGTATKRVEPTFGSQDYALEQEALEGKVPRELMDEAAAVPGVDLGRMAVEEVMGRLMLALEYQRATLARNAANYDADHKVDLAAAKWSDDDNSPSADIAVGRSAVRSSIGRYPNIAVIGAAAYEAAKANAQIIERFKYTSKDSITPEMLAALWDLDAVVVGKAVTADAAGTFTDVWGSDVVLAYVPPALSSMTTPSYGMTYVLKGHPMVEKAYWDQRAKSWIYPVTYERKPVLTGILAGYLAQNAA